ncbi:hypothetical protein [Longimicrobium sp.]|uniref:hypothetical protein n=1 Tax=Longimicrobium sp. TaxID=2029185 RepID=UPI002E3054AD|nr:hypothetical protein [Longimicrobium sp.]HEX6037945.1 hypothetical protein [Longimicrobium sp.]
MKKLSLNVDSLTVQSFETMETPTPRGTVHGNASEPILTCEEGDLSYPGSCEPATCYAGCGGNTNTCPRPTREITCEASAPSPDGTCCYITC